MDLIKLMKIKNDIYVYSDNDQQEMKAKRNQTKDYLVVDD